MTNTQQKKFYVHIFCKCFVCDFFVWWHRCLFQVQTHYSSYKSIIMLISFYAATHYLSTNVWKLLAPPAAVPNFIKVFPIILEMKAGIVNLLHDFQKWTHYSEVYAVIEWIFVLEWYGILWAFCYFKGNWMTLIIVQLSQTYSWFIVVLQIMQPISAWW